MVKREQVQPSFVIARSSAKRSDDAISGNNSVTEIASPVVIETTTGVAMTMDQPEIASLFLDIFWSVKESLAMTMGSTPTCKDQLNPSSRGWPNRPPEAISETMTEIASPCRDRNHDRGRNDCVKGFCWDAP